MNQAAPDDREGFAAFLLRLRGKGIVAKNLIAAFESTPRRGFLPDRWQHVAWAEGMIPIDCGEAIEGVDVQARVIAALALEPGHKVLEVGAGSGYAAAVISRIAESVVAIERHGELAQIARERMARLGYDNVRIIQGDGTRGCADEAPFDAILAAASGSHVPKPLVDQLAPGGRLVMPVGDPGFVQELVKVTKRPDGTTSQENLGGVRFVPLIGEEGWHDN